MNRINLTEYHRLDWKSFIFSDDKKRHWINQRILEDENQWLEERPQPTPRAYVQEPKPKVNPLKVMYMFLP